MQKHLPKIPKKPRYRFSTTDRGMMYSTAAFFDAVQLISKIFVILGMAIATGTSVIPVAGWLVGAGAIGLGNGIDMAFGALVGMLGYATLWMWLQIKRAPIFGGKYLGRKALMFPLCFLIELTPMVNTLPTTTFWTWRMIKIADKEDKEAHAKMVASLTRAHHAFMKREETLVLIREEMEAREHEARLVAMAQQRNSTETTFAT
jgi:hypothetical protein